MQSIGCKILAVGVRVRVELRGVRAVGPGLGRRARNLTESVAGVHLYTKLRHFIFDLMKPTSGFRSNAVSEVTSDTTSMTLMLPRITT